MADAVINTAKQLRVKRANLLKELFPFLAAGSVHPISNGGREDEQCEASDSYAAATSAIADWLEEVQEHVNAAQPDRVFSSAGTAGDAGGATTLIPDRSGLAVVAQTARALANLQQQRALQAAGVAAHAKEAGDVSRAAEAAMEAGEAAGLAVWAASIGGRDLMRELRGAQEEAMRAAEAAAEDAWAAEQAARDALAAAAAECKQQAAKLAVSGQADPLVTEASTSQQALLFGNAAVQLSGGSPEAAAASLPCSGRLAAMSSTCCSQRGATAVAGSDGVPVLMDAPKAIATATTGAAAPAADRVAAEQPKHAGSGVGASPATAPAAADAAATSSLSQVAFAAPPADVVAMQAEPQAADPTSSTSAPPKSPAGSRFTVDPGDGISILDRVHEYAGTGDLASGRAAQARSCSQDPCAALPAGLAGAQLARLHALVDELASAARFITPDGGLPPEVLESASALAFKVLEFAPPVAMRQALSPAPRPGIMELVSLAVRRAADGPCSESAADRAAAVVRNEDWQQWLLLLRGCLLILEAQVPPSPTAVTLNTDCLYGRRPEAFVETVLRTDLMPALSRVSAAAAAAASAFSSGGDDGESGSGRGRSVNGEEELNAWGLAVGSTCSFLWSLRKLAAELSACTSAVPELLPPPLRLQLVRAIRESYVLEHSARAVMALLGPAPCREALGCDELDELADSLTSLLQVACTAVPMPENEAPRGPYRGAPGAVTRRRLQTLASSSPCLQHLLLLHTLAQLRAVDGGTDYGLPPGAALPALEDGYGVFWPWEVQSDVDTEDGEEEEKDTKPTPVTTEYIPRALHCWSDSRVIQEASMPCSRPGLWALCMRLAAGAHLSWEALHSGLERIPRYQFTNPPSVELVALGLAARLTCGQAAVGSMRQLWAPVVRAVNRVMTAPHLLDDYAAAAEALLFQLKLPRSPGYALPAEPPADVAAALASGYVACMELTLRQLARLQRSPEGMAVFCFGGIGKILHKGGSLAQLLAYGDLPSLASAIATGAKVLRQGVRSAMEAIAEGIAERMCAPGASCSQASDAPAAVGQALAYLGQALSAGWPALCGDQGVGPEDEHWWRKLGAAADAGRAGRGDGCQVVDGGSGGDSGSDAARAHAVGGGAKHGRNDIVNGDGLEDAASSGGERSGDNGDGSGRLPPLQQLMLLSSWTLALSLPHLSRSALAMPDAHVYNEFVLSALLPWVPPLVLAYLECRAAAVEAVARPAAATGSKPSMCSDAAAALQAEASARSWRHLLLEEMCLGLIFTYRAFDTLPDGQEMWMYGIDSRLDALLHFAVAFPDRALRVLNAQAPSDCDGGSTLLQALLRRCKGHSCEAARFFSQVITTVGAGRPPTGCMIARLRSGDYRDIGVCGAQYPNVKEHVDRVTAALRAAPLLLPPPYVAAALLRLPLCANLGCTNLEGDSEAGLRLSGCRRCGGAVSYCSKECQVAHWRAGHREACVAIN